MYDDIFTTTLENRSGSLADNVTKNNGLLRRLRDKKNIREITGGSKILEELENILSSVRPLQSEKKGSIL